MHIPDESKNDSNAKNNIKSLKAKLILASGFSKRFQYSKALMALSKILENTTEKKSEEELRKEALILKIDIEKKSNRFRIRIIISILFLFSLFTVSILHYLKVSSTEIIAEVNTDICYFELTEDHVLESIQFESIVLSDVKQLMINADSIRILPNENRFSEGNTTNKNHVSFNPFSPILLRNTSGSGTIKISGSECKLQQFELYKGVPILFDLSSRTNPTLTIRQTSSKAYGVIETGNKTFVECDNCEMYQEGGTSVYANQFVIYHNLYEITFNSDTRPIDAVIILPSNEAENNNIIMGLPKLKVIDFTTNSWDQPVSLINSATIKFTELDNEQISLSKNEFLFLKDFNPFYVRQFGLDTQLKLLLQGEVGSIESGSGRVLYSRMPSMLKWIYVNKNINLIIATVSGIFTFLLAVFLKFQILNKND